MGRRRDGAEADPAAGRRLSGRPVVLALAGALVLVALALIAFRPSSRSESVRGPVVGEPAPTFSTFDLAGQPVELADHRGQTVLVNFWASWCSPCRREFPLLAAVRSDRVEVLGVVFQDAPETAADFMREQGATWPGLVDPRGQIADAYGVAQKPGIPVTFAVDPEGVLRGRHLGEARAGDLERMVRGAS